MWKVWSLLLSNCGMSPPGSCAVWEGCEAFRRSPKIGLGVGLVGWDAAWPCFLIHVFLSPGAIWLGAAPAAMLLHHDTLP